MDVRPARPEDAAEITRLRELLFDAFGMQRAGGWQETCEHVLRQGLAMHQMAAFVADDPERRGRLVSAGLGIVVQRLPAPGNPSGRWGHILSMYTEERVRRQGAARAILEGLLDWFRSRGIPDIDLSATPEAEALYRGHGFVDKPWGRPLQLRIEGLTGTRPDRC